MRLDSLVHATRNGRWFDTNLDASLTTLLRQMDAACVERAMMVGLAGFIDNQYVQDCVRSHPDRFWGGGGFNPAACTSRSELSSALRREVLDRGFAAIKLHPRLNKYDLADACCTSFFEEIDSLARPPVIWLDTLLYRPDSTLSRDPVGLIHSLAVTWPRLQFVCLHSAGPLALQLAEAVRFCPNVMLDLSYTMARFEGYSFMNDMMMLARRFDRRLIWGSDFPEISVPETVDVMERFVAPLSSAQTERIRWQNLQELMSKNSA